MKSVTNIPMAVVARILKSHRLKFLRNFNKIVINSLTLLYADSFFPFEMKGKSWGYGYSKPYFVIYASPGDPVFLADFKNKVEKLNLKK
jgi:hypothetical protein